MNGRALAKRLGKGWKFRIWENGGWNYSAISPCGRIKVHTDTFKDRTTYTAFLGEVGEPGGLWAENGRTPEIAIRKVVATAKRALGKIRATLEGL